MIVVVVVGVVVILVWVVVIIVGVVVLVGAIVEVDVVVGLKVVDAEDVISVVLEVGVIEEECEVSIVSVEVDSEDVIAEDSADCSSFAEVFENIDASVSIVDSLADEPVVTEYGVVISSILSSANDVVGE